MPGFFYEPIDRKQFLTRAATLGAATFFPWRQLAANDEPANEENADNESRVTVALLSDTHIPAQKEDGYRDFSPQENLTKVVPQVVEAKPKIAVIDGDAARLDGQVDDYRVLREILSPIAAIAPIHIGLGNHDDRANFYQVFPADAESKATQSVNGKHVTVIDTPVVRLIVLDSLLYVNKVAGLLGKNQRDWLTEYLAAVDDQPIALFVHHTLSDSDGSLLDVDRLFTIIEPHKNVKAIFYGHSHRYEVSEQANVRLINLPAIGYNFTDDQPVGWIEAEFRADGVSMKLHTVAGNESENGKTTEVSWL
jgi:3',5'-cyclic AMP phosphodiesterase CpdA